MNWGYLLGITDPYGYLKKDCQEQMNNNSSCSWTYSAYKELSEGKWTSAKFREHVQSKIYIFILIRITRVKFMSIYDLQLTPL